MGGEDTGLKQLLQELHTLNLPLELSGVEGARANRKRSYDRLRDHILPRLENLDAPLLCVVGGSTGAGKSTIVNSLLGRIISASSAVRPTTRRPILMHRAEDTNWFERGHVLPGLARVRVDSAAGPSEPSSGSHKELELRQVDTVPHGIAILDAPDLDSVVDDNRELARQLLDAADLWVFVTTAARYADALPWQTLREAAQRNIAVTIVLNRIPPGAEEEIHSDLTRMLATAGLGRAPILCISEQALNSAMLSPATLTPLRNWLTSLADTAQSRRHTARRAVYGSVRTVLADSTKLSEAVQQQAQVLTDANATVDNAAHQARRYIRSSAQKGALLRGEVLNRWQEVLGTADLGKSIDASISWVRGKLAGIFGNQNDKRAEPVHAAIADNLTTVITTAITRAEDEVRAAWRRDNAVRLYEEATPPLDAGKVRMQADKVTRQWQHDLLEMIREQGGARKTAARMLAVGVNLLGVSLMVVIFASTGGLTGAEVGVAGATSVVAQRLLESVFGSKEVAAMTKRAVQLLDRRCTDLIENELSVFHEALPPTPDAETFNAAVAHVAKQWEAAHQRILQGAPGAPNPELADAGTPELSPARTPMRENDPHWETVEGE
ncbi:MAG: dynamin family protein [Actinomycetaceae bacterium]|nr:dynamin family protein [Actinomycetaceae bacterium]